MQQTWLICVSEIDFIMHARVYVRCVVCVALLMWAFFLFGLDMRVVCFCLFVCCCRCMLRFFLLCTYVLMHDVIFMNVYICIYPSLFCLLCMLCMCVLFFICYTSACFYLFIIYVLMYPSLFFCCVCCVCVYYFSFVIHQRVFIYLLFMC